VVKADNRTLFLIEESIATAGGVRRRAEYAAAWLLDDPQRAMDEIEQIYQYASDWERQYQKVLKLWNDNGRPDIFSAGWQQGQLYD
jgi:hypothetical protein